VQQVDDRVATMRVGLGFVAGWQVHIGPGGGYVECTVADQEV
jgi:hypothetical protein